MPHWKTGGPHMQPDWIQHIEKRLIDIETRQAVEVVHRANVSERLSAIEDTLKWLMRLVIGGLLMGGLAYVLKGGLLLGG